jgi:hypothetical protein
MNWSVVLCQRCSAQVLVPGEVGERVARGESAVWCESCIRDHEAVEVD